MPQSKAYARRLMRELPDDPAALLKSKSYTRKPFLELFFDWLDDLIYRDPQTGLRWARVAPDLALKAPEKAGPGGRQAHRACQVLAWIRLGSAYRACSDFSASQRAYSEALKLIASEAIPDLVKAQTDFRLSYLRSCQARHEEALQLASAAVDVLRKIDSQSLPDALMAQGYALETRGLHTEAINAFGEALSLVSSCAKRSTPQERLLECACNNLAMVLAAGSLADQDAALLYIRATHRLLRGQKRSPTRYRLFWIEAMIWHRTGSHAKAKRLYRRALEGFEILRLPWEAALVALDLCALLHLVGDLSELTSLAEHTFKTFSGLSGAGNHTLSALRLWVDAVRSRSWEQADEKDLARSLRRYDALHEDARQTILAGVLSSQCCKAKVRR